MGVTEFEMNVRDLRQCLARFATGVTVVTWMQDKGIPHGMTVNSFTSISLTPALVLVSIAKQTKSHDALSDRPYVINILSSKQERLARQFAGQLQADLTVEWEEPNVYPKLKDAIAVIECTPWQKYDGGDHTLFIGEVQSFSYTDGEALLFYQGKFLETNLMVER